MVLLPFAPIVLRHVLQITAFCSTSSLWNLNDSESHSPVCLELPFFLTGSIKTCMLSAVWQVKRFLVGRGGLMMHWQHVGGVTLLHADTLLMPWQFKLDGYHKAILTIIRGTTHNTSSIFNIWPTPTWDCTCKKQKALSSSLKFVTSKIVTCSHHL